MASSLRGQVIVNEVTLNGAIDASSTMIEASTRWGKIKGDINDQSDLIEILNTKEETEVQKISKFFKENEKYNYKFLISIANQDIDSVKEYIQYVIDDKNQNGVLWIPYNPSAMCMIIRASSQALDQVIRFFVPLTGEIGNVDISDEDDSGKVRFTYAMIGDDQDESARWGNIFGKIEDQADLMALLEEKLNKSDNITTDEINTLFVL